MNKMDLKGKMKAALGKAKKMTEDSKKPMKKKMPSLKKNQEMPNRCGMKV